ELGDAARGVLTALPGRRELGTPRLGGREPLLERCRIAREGLEGLELATPCRRRRFELRQRRLDRPPLVDEPRVLADRRIDLAQPLAQRIEAVLGVGVPRPAGTELAGLAAGLLGVVAQRLRADPGEQRLAVVLRLPSALVGRTVERFAEPAGRLERRAADRATLLDLQRAEQVEVERLLEDLPQECRGLVAGETLDPRREQLELGAAAVALARREALAED